MGKSLASNKRGGKSKVERMSEIMGRDFICPYALNPYHDCSEICFKKVSENFQNEGKETVQDKGMKKVQRKGVTPTSLKALKSFNSCARNLFSINPAVYQGRTKGMWLISDRSDVHSNCKNASNPYHKCAEYCFDNVPYRDQPGQVMQLDSLDGDNAFNIRGRTSLQSQCIYASIPQHECGEVCFENGQDSNRHEGENFIDVSTSTDRSSPLPNHINASTPCHQVVECFFENIPEQKHLHKALNPKEEIKTLVAAESGVKLERKVAPSYHIDGESCFQNLLEEHDLQAMMMEKEEKEVASIPQIEVNLSRKIISDPYIEYCFKNVLEKDQPGLAFTKSKEENKIALTGERRVNPECVFASNPYHACAEYCFENVPHRERPGHVKKLRSLKKIVSNKETSVNRKCKFASNPYHECGRDCFQTKLDQNKAVGVSMKLKKENKEVVLGERGVDPKCQFASNPYHVCAEYCIQNVPEREKHGSVMKLNSQLEITVVSNKETTNVHPDSKFASNSYHQCDGHCFHNELDQNIGEGGKKETNHVLRSDVNSMCKFTSNPFHKCSEYCSEGHQYKNHPVECIPVITEEEKRNSLSEMRCHLIMEKSTVNWELVEASRPTYNNIESSIGIIFPDRIKKSSKDSKFVEASNPDTDYAEFSKGITMPDVQLLQLDASHLFLEWAKYCTQTPEYEVVMQAERRGFGTKNVQDNCKYYDSSILEKFNAEGSLQRSLSTSVLFFLGFLFALFKWTQMIQSVVMSSDRKKISGSVMHKKHVESK